MSEASQLNDLAQVIAYFKQNIWAIGPEVQLTLWATLGCLLLDFLLPAESKRWISLVALAGVAFASVHLYKLAVEGARGTAFNQTVVVDSFSLFFKAIFLISLLISIIISIKYLDIEEEQHGEYYALLMYATIGMMFAASGTDLITLFIGLELMTVCEYVLVGYLRGERRSNEAALKFFLLGAFSTGILLYGMSLLYGYSGSTHLGSIGEAVAAGPKSNLLLLAMIMLVAGMGFKIAAVPFHMWAPDAYEGAPTSITAFISVGPKAAAFAMLARIFLEAIGPLSPDYTLLLGMIAAVTMTWGNIAAVTQSNVKRLFAYSTISHVGFILLGIVAGPGNDGLVAAAIYLFIYAFMNLGAFAIIISLRRKEIIGEAIDDFSGLIVKSPGLAVLMTVFLLSLAGIPPTAGFIAKYYVFAALIKAYFNTGDRLMSLLAVVGVINAVIGLFYYWNIVKAMYIRAPQDQLKLSLSPGLVAAIAITFIFTLGIGLYPNPFIEMARAASLALR